jgi:very-short-patch-repair endonuclease
VRETGDRGLSLAAAAQRGLVHRGQLQALGFSPGTIARRVAAGSLHRVLPAVFAVGHPALEPLGAETAAVLYAGDDCVLSHASAAAIWGLLPVHGAAVTLTLVRRHLRHRPGLRIHRVCSVDVLDVRLRNGLPLTAPARTLIDLAADASDDVLERAIVEARVLGLASEADLEGAIDRSPLRAGTRRMRALLSTERGPALTRSEAERRLRVLVDSGRLERPRFNVWLHGHLVDAVWDGPGLVIEVDGFGVHGHRSAFETDRRRDQILVANGYVVVRVTWRQLTSEPMAVLARLSQALALAGRRNVG